MARGRRLTQAQVEELRRDAAGLSGPALRAWAKGHADLLGCHVSTIYRAVQGETRTRKRRADAGQLKVMDEELLLDIAAIVRQFDYDVETAIATMNANLAAAGLPLIDVHPETVRRHLREMGVSRRHNRQDLRVHRRFEAPYPGYLFQMDSTVAASYYIDVDDSIGYEAPVRRNKNKPGNERPRVWLIGGIDDHSRVRWARFYPANSAEAWLDFLLRVMRGFHEDPLIWPAFGVFERVYTDQDSAMKSGVVTRALEALGIERILANPSTEWETNAQAKGKAEATLRVLQSFEKVTRWKRFAGLEAMNGALLKHLIFLNNRVHSETREVPFQRWIRRQSVTVLPPEEITRRLSRREEERVITRDVAIQLEGKIYQLPRRRPFIDFVGQRVRVLYYEADRSKLSVVLDGEEHEVDAVEAVPDTAGEIKRAPTPKAVDLRRALEKRDLSHIDPHLVFEHRAADPPLHLARPKLVEHPLTADMLAPRMVKRGPAIDRMQRAGVVGAPPSPADKEAIDDLMGGRPEIPEAELMQWIEARRSGGRGGAAASAQRA